MSIFVCSGGLGDLTRIESFGCLSWLERGLLGAKSAFSACNCIKESSIGGLRSTYEFFKLILELPHHASLLLG
jgi:hypothetical protein